MRPTAVEVYQDGYNPRAVRERAGSWIRFVASMGDLTDEQRRALKSHGAFIDALDTTEMVKSYKMLVLLAMLNADRFPGSISDRRARGRSGAVRKSDDEGGRGSGTGAWR